jgi:hypothetical protein
MFPIADHGISEDRDIFSCLAHHPVILRCRAEKALAMEGEARTRLGYEVLVKLKMDELLEQEYLPADVSHEGGPAEIAAT